MMATELRSTLGEPTPPAGLPLLVEAMWWEAHGDWARAHSMVDELSTREGAWVHAYVHRSQGDTGNAGYWYREAGRQASQKSLPEEWLEIVEALLVS